METQRNKKEEIHRCGSNIDEIEEPREKHK